MMLGIGEDRLVSLITVEFDTFKLTPRSRLRNTQRSLSNTFSNCRSPRKLLATNFLVKKLLLHLSQLCVQIGRIIVSNSLSNTLRYPDGNLLAPRTRVYITLLALLQSSWMFMLKFLLFIIIVPRYGQSLQISRGSFLRFYSILLRQLSIVIPRQLSGFSISFELGIEVIISLGHSSGYMWVCKILLNKIA